VDDVSGAGDHEALGADVDGGDHVQVDGVLGQDDLLPAAMKAQPTGGTWVERRRTGRKKTA